jgi:hypothetical protein
MLASKMSEATLFILDLSVSWSPRNRNGSGCILVDHSAVVGCPREKEVYTVSYPKNVP